MFEGLYELGWIRSALGRPTRDPRDTLCSRASHPRPATRDPRPATPRRRDATTPRRRRPHLTPTAALYAPTLLAKSQCLHPSPICPRLRRIGLSRTAAHFSMSWTECHTSSQKRLHRRCTRTHPHPHSRACLHPHARPRQWTQTVTCDRQRPRHAHTTEHAHAHAHAGTL